LKTIVVRSNVSAEVRGIKKEWALDILHAIHLYAKAGVGDLRPLKEPLRSLQRLRAGRYRVILEEFADKISVRTLPDRGERGDSAVTVIAANLKSRGVANEAARCIEGLHRDS